LVKPPLSPNGKCCRSSLTQSLLDSSPYSKRRQSGVAKIHLK
jgi:hypothetical protein